eukprot:355785-Rhodomonas_salina.1
MVGVVVVRCDAGVEAVRGVVTMVGSDLSQFPDDDGIENDDDNDAIHVSAIPENGRASVVFRCRLSMGEDDGIDHDHAKLVVKQSRITLFLHEGIAASGLNPAGGAYHGEVCLEDVVITRCEHGIELGYGGAAVRGKSLLVVENAVGVRYGCEHAWGHVGTMQLSEAVIAFNRRHDYLNAFPEPPHHRPAHVALSCALLGAQQASLAHVMAAHWLTCGRCTNLLLPPSPSPPASHPNAGEAEGGGMGA